MHAVSRNQGHTSVCASQCSDPACVFCPGTGEQGLVLHACFVLVQGNKVVVLHACFVQVQGDKEKACGLPVSPLMDRSLQGGMTRSQMGFFNIVGTPMFKAMVDLFPDARPMLDGVAANYNQWEQAAALAAVKAP